MSKKPDKRFNEWTTENVRTGEVRSGGSGGGCSPCLLNLSLLLAAPTAAVALVVKRVRR